MVTIMVVVVTLMVVDRIAGEPPENWGYTVRLPDGRERNTVRARLRLREP